MITKKQFIAYLKNSRATKVRVKIRKLRKDLKEIGWTLKSRYYKKYTEFKLYIHNANDHINLYDDRENVKCLVENHFPISQYIFYGDDRHITITVDEDPNFYK